MRQTVLLFCACLFFSASFVNAEGISKLDSKIWLHDMQKAHQIAISENKPMLIVFGASWCKYCKKLENETLSDSRMEQYIKQNFIPVHLDLDEEKNIGKILEIKSLPCTIVLSPKADLLGKIVGFKSVEAMYEQLQKTLKTDTVFRQASQKNRKLK